MEIWRLATYGHGLHRSSILQKLLNKICSHIDLKGSATERQSIADEVCMQSVNNSRLLLIFLIILMI